MRETGSKTGIAYRLYYLGLAADAQGDHGAAISSFRESLALHREAGDRLGVSMSLAGLGDWAGAREAYSNEQREHALRVLSAASAQYEAMGHNIRPRDREKYEQGLSAARSQLGDEAFERAIHEGRSMSMEQAIEYGLKAEL